MEKRGYRERRKGKKVRIEGGNSVLEREDIVRCLIFLE